MPENDKPEKARELTTAIELVAAVAPAVLTADPVSALVGTLAVGGKRLLDNHLLRRQKKLDELIRESINELSIRIDQSVKIDEFVALYIRARETAARSEREAKLEYIRNFLLNAVIEPTSRVEDKEPYLRLLDDFSAGELAIFIAFCTAAGEANHRTVAEFIAKSDRAFLMVHAFTRHFLGLPPTGPPTLELQLQEPRIATALRRFEGATLLDGVRTGGVGDPYAYRTNMLTRDSSDLSSSPSHPNSPSICVRPEIRRLTRGRTRRGPASARRPSRLGKSKSARRRAACIARLTCRQAVRRAAVATWALAARVNL